MTSATNRFLGLFRPHLKGLVLGTVLLVIAANIPAAIVVLIKVVLDDVLIKQDHATLVAMPFAVAGLYGLSALVNISRGLLTKSISFKVVERLRVELMEQYLRLGVAYHQHTPPVSKSAGWPTTSTTSNTRSRVSRRPFRSPSP